MSKPKTTHPYTDGNEEVQAMPMTQHGYGRFIMKNRYWMQKRHGHPFPPMLPPEPYKWGMVVFYKVGPHELDWLCEWMDDNQFNQKFRRK